MAVRCSEHREERVLLMPVLHSGHHAVDKVNVLSNIAREKNFHAHVDGHHVWRNIIFWISIFRVRNSSDLPPRRRVDTPMLVDVEKCTAMHKSFNSAAPAIVQVSIVVPGCCRRICRTSSRVGFPVHALFLLTKTWMLLALLFATTLAKCH